MSEHAPEERPEEEDENEDRPHPFGLVPLIIIAILIVGGGFLITRLNADTNMQDCIQSGRRNCAPIDTTGR